MCITRGLSLVSFWINTFESRGNELHRQPCAEAVDKSGLHLIAAWLRWTKNLWLNFCFTLCWGPANAEIKIPSAEIPRSIQGILFQTWGMLEQMILLLAPSSSLPAMLFRNLCLFSSFHFIYLDSSSSLKWPVVQTFNYSWYWQKIWYKNDW